MMKKDHFEDDGRTVADMSDISRRPLFGHLPGEKAPARTPAQPEQQKDEAHPRGNSAFSKEDRRAVFFGSLKATLLIGSVYLLGFALIILLLCILGR